MQCVGILDRLGKVFAGEHSLAPVRTRRVQVLPAAANWIEVVGESFHRESFRLIVGDHMTDRFRLPVACQLIPEPANTHDRNAIGVWVDDRQVGHVSRDDAQFIAPVLRSWMQRDPGTVFAAEGEIVGAGWDRCGVYLRLDTRDFGAPAPPPHEPAVRTGLSSAPQGSVAWFGDLSDDRITRVKQLRRLMSSETEPISRHFVASELEEVLYRLRDDIPSALSEFDEVAEAHHRELAAATRALLLRQYGGVPLLDLYRQASIRHQREGDLEGALEWAERGIVAYGEQALRPEWLDDLRHRAERLSRRVQAAQARMDRAEHAQAEHAVRSASSLPAPVALESEMETLTCQQCGGTFERIRTRGRKPHRCPECSASAVN